MKITCGCDDRLCVPPASERPHEHHILAFCEWNRSVAMAHWRSILRFPPRWYHRFEGHDDFAVGVTFSRQAVAGANTRRRCWRNVILQQNTLLEELL